MNASRSIRFIRKQPGNFVKPCTRPEARVILLMENCCWSYWCITEIACVLWEQDDEPTRRLLMLVEQRRHWVEEKKRHGNRLSARLKVYFPQVLNWFDDIGAAPVLNLLVPAVQDAVLLDSYVLEVTALVALLKQMQMSIKKFDTAIAARKLGVFALKLTENAHIVDVISALSPSPVLGAGQASSNSMASLTAWRSFCLRPRYRDASVTEFC
jgi:hypothetical protein